nr:hypothetical protein GCM10020092_061490 [Actinoplanes digitatis]
MRDPQLVGAGEVGVGHEDLAADLDRRRAGERGGQPGDQAGLGGDVLVGPAVAAGGEPPQPAVDVAGRDRHAVDLRLDRVAVHGVAEDPVEAGRPGAQLVGVEDVVEAEHRGAVLDVAAGDARADRGGRGAGLDPAGLGPLGGGDPGQQGVVGGVVHGEVVAGVVGLGG